MASEAVHVIRFGMIKCEIFRQQTRNGERFNVTITRLYRNGSVWAQSRLFGRDDLPLVCKAVDLAHTWIYARGQASSSAANNHEEQKS